MQMNLGLDVEPDYQYIDSVGSVSALDSDEDTFVLDAPLLDEQYRRFLNGS